MKMGLAYFLDKTRYFALLSRKSNEKPLGMLVEHSKNL